MYLRTHRSTTKATQWVWHFAGQTVIRLCPIEKLRGYSLLCNWSVRNNKFKKKDVGDISKIFLQQKAAVIKKQTEQYLKWIWHKIFYFRIIEIFVQRYRSVIFFWKTWCQEDYLNVLIRGRAAKTWPMSGNEIAPKDPHWLDVVSVLWLNLSQG